MTITVEQIESKVREIAAAQPDFVYRSGDGTSCVYVDENDAGSCIVGRALVDLGVPASFFQSSRNATVIDVLWHTLEDKGFVAPLHEEEEFRKRRWIAYVQRQQDTGDSWGMAVSRADMSVL